MSEAPTLYKKCQAITVVVQDEDGKPLAGDVVWRGPMLPADDDLGFPCLRFVDPYGDTVFNQIQIPVFLNELRRLLDSPLPDEQACDIRAVTDLVEPFVVDRTLFYVKLIGD
jgi:hypothetical protein